MTGRRPFSELIKDWPPERRRRVEEGTARLSAEVEAAMAAERVGKRARVADANIGRADAAAERNPNACGESAAIPALPRRSRRRQTRLA